MKLRRQPEYRVLVLRDGFELLGAATLFLAAVYALRAVSRDVTRFSLIAGLGTAFLGVDELFDLHERLGRAAYADWDWPQPPLVNHHDDLFLLVIALTGFAVIAYFRREVLRQRTFAVLFGAGLALFAAAVAWDTRADQTGSFSWWTEESLELAGGAAMAVAFRWRLRAQTAAPVPDGSEPANLSEPAPGGELE